MSLFYFLLLRTGCVHCQLPCLTETAESITWSLKISIKLLILCFGLRLFGGLQQFAVSRCFRFPIMLVILIQCENTLLLVAGCSWSTIYIVVHFWFVFLTATCSCCGEDLPGIYESTRADSRNRFSWLSLLIWDLANSRVVFFFFAHGIAQVLISSLLMTAWLQGRSTECSYHHVEAWG